MKIVKWAVFFIVSFIISWAVIATFSQVAFKMTAPAKIAFYTTPEIPMYLYTIGAFFLGLVIGLSIAIYNYLALRSSAGKNSSYARQLEDEIGRLKKQLNESEPHTDTVKENFSALAKAEGERLMDEEPDDKDNKLPAAEESNEE